MATYKRYEFKGGYRKVPKEVVHAALRYAKDLTNLDLNILFIIMVNKTTHNPEPDRKIIYDLLTDHHRYKHIEESMVKMIPILAEYPNHQRVSIGKTPPPPMHTTHKQNQRVSNRTSITGTDGERFRSIK
jgi:hypothetical protein